MAEDEGDPFEGGDATKSQSLSVDPLAQASKELDPFARETSDDGPEGDEDDEFDGLDDDLASLISFANLESVVKHIINKFKLIEARSDKAETTIEDLKKGLESRASISTLDEVVGELRGTVATVNKGLQSQKDNIGSLESALERNKILCAQIDKKLEATVKEKSVQDRLIREVQDALQDKVAVAELNMFEAKFAGYTTKLEHQEVIQMLSDYTRVDMTERLQETMKALANRFNDYTRTARIDELFQDVRDWVNAELLNYALIEKTAHRFKDLEMEIKDQATSAERGHSLMDDKIRGLSDRMTSLYTELTDDLKARALTTDLDTIQKEMRSYALRAETDAFQQDCVPKLKYCVDSIAKFDERLKAQDASIQRVDEVLLDKAGKYEIVVANSRIEQCFQKDKAMKELNKMYDRLQWMADRLEHYVSTETERFNQFKPPDYTAVFDDIHSKVALKADKADLVEMYRLKANRIDSDELAKLQDTIHRQLEYLAITSFGCAKLVLTEAKPSESKSLRLQQKSQVLMQSESLWHWILHNEPPPNLDTLKSPATRGVAAANARAQAGADAADREKRAKDDQNRTQLEKKLGIQQNN